jgi:hypothetical protein
MNNYNLATITTLIVILSLPIIRKLFQLYSGNVQTGLRNLLRAIRILFEFRFTNIHK